MIWVCSFSFCPPNYILSFTYEGTLKPCAHDLRQFSAVRKGCCDSLGVISSGNEHSMDICVCVYMYLNTNICKSFCLCKFASFLNGGGRFRNNLSFSYLTGVMDQKISISVSDRVVEVLQINEYFQSRALKFKQFQTQ